MDTWQRWRGCASVIMGSFVLACSDGPTVVQQFNPGLNDFTSLLDDSAAAHPDSVHVQLPAGTHWVLSHGGAEWLSIATASGSGAAWLRWQRDPTPLAPGVYVDTLILVRDDGQRPVQFLDSLEIRTIPSEFITSRRPWRPGERDSAIAWILANNGLGMASSLAAQILSPDWTIDVIPNPAYHAPAGAPGLTFDVTSPTTAGMTLTGLDILNVDNTAAPPDTIMQWLWLFWYSTTSPTYKGYAVVFSRNATGGPFTLNDNTWTANGGTSGGGGGEINPGTGEYWSWTSGTFQVTANSTRAGAPATIPSGPFMGGEQRNGLMGGRIRNGVLSRVLPATGPRQSVSLDYRTAGNQIASARIVCIFNSPCTTNALRMALRAGSMGRR